MTQLFGSSFGVALSATRLPRDPRERQLMPLVKKSQILLRDFGHSSNPVRRERQPAALCRNTDKPPFSGGGWTVEAVQRVLWWTYFFIVDAAHTQNTYPLLFVYKMVYKRKAFPKNMETVQLLPLGFDAMLS